MMKHSDLVAERLLDLTLEILYLLTGEDYIVGKSGNLITHSTNHRVSGAPSRIQSHNLEPPPHNEQKILELTHRILRLLTGEVPIRCEDVTVHLSMEEWEYVERHKDIYKDVMMEDDQALDSLDSTKAATSSFETQNSSSPSPRQQGCTPEVHPRAVDPPDARNPSRDIPKALRLRERGHLSDVCGTVGEVLVEYPSTHVKEEPDSWEDVGFINADRFLITERMQPEWPPTDIKEEPASCDEGDATDANMFPPAGYTHREYPSSRIEEEPALCEDGNVTDTDIYPPIEPAQIEYICHVMEGLPSHEDGGLFEPTEYPLFTFTEYGNVPLETHQLMRYQGWDQEQKTYPRSNIGKYIYHKIPFESSIDLHRRLHPEKTLHACPECGKCFNQKSVLVRHLRIHTGEKPYSCCECGKSFRQKAVLVRHQKIHTSGKPYSCSECWKFFSYESDLLRHQDIHNLRKDHACSECGKFFRHQSDLKRHRRMHTGEKPFSCFKCEKCFTQKSNLVKHLTVHTQQMPQPDHGRRPSPKTKPDGWGQTPKRRSSFTAGDVRVV